MNNRLQAPNNKGFTFVEIVMVIVILGIIGGITFQFVVHGVEVFKKSRDRKELYDQGRLALERMAREIRDAYSVEVIDSATNSSFTFKKKHPDESADNIEEIKYEFDDANDQLKRVADPNGNEGGPYPAKVLASNVSGFTVTSMITGVSAGTETCTIEVDQVSSAADPYPTTNTNTLSHPTSAGSNRMVIICTAHEGSRTVTGVTYGGSSADPVGSRQVESGGTYQTIEMWRVMEAGISGRVSDDVVVTWSGDPYSPGIAVMSFTGVDQAAVPVTGSSAVLTTNYIDTSITTPADGSLVVTNVGAGDNSTYSSHGTGQVEQWNRTLGSHAHSGTTRIVTTAGPVTLSETNSASVNRQAHLVAAFPPATTCGAGGSNTIIAINNVSTGTTDGPDSITISHTTSSGNDRLMLVGISLQNARMEYVRGVTYNGTPLTLVGTEARDDDSKIEIWKLVSPESGTHNVEINFNKSLSNGATAGVMTFTGVDPATPHGTFTFANGDSSTASISIPSATDELVYGVAVAEDQSSALTTDSGQDEQWSLGADSYDSAGAGSTEAGAANVSMSWTVNSSNDWAVGAISLRQTRMVELELTLNSEEGGTVRMRTKVYMRNYQ